MRPGAGSANIFVGRDGDMDVLRTALDEAVSGQGRLVMMAGEPGIGKTRVASELAAYAQTQAARVFWGWCYEGEGAPPYWPWVQPIRAFIRASAPAELEVAWKWDVPQNRHSEERSDEAPTPSRVLDNVGKSLSPSAKILRFSQNGMPLGSVEARPRKWDCGSLGVWLQSSLSSIEDAVVHALGVGEVHQAAQRLKV